MVGVYELISGDYAIVKLFPPGPGKDEAKDGGLAGEIIYVATTRDVKDWKKAGEWCVYPPSPILNE